MTSNSLLRAVRELQQRHHPSQASPSWSHVVEHLLRQLKLYSTGLSLSIASDSLAVTSTHRRAEASSLQGAMHEACIIATSPAGDKNLSVWQLQLLHHGGRIMAHLPHSSLTTLTVPIGVSVSIALNADDLVDGECLTVAQKDALQIAVRALRSTSLAENGPEAHSDPHSDHTAHHDVQGADTPSQTSTTFKPPTLVSYATTALLFHMDTFPKGSLPIPHDLNHYSLERVWRDRDVSPVAMYAHIVAIDHDNATVRLQDSHLWDGTQPSVDCYFSPDRAPLLKSLSAGDTLLLLSPAVHPTDDSFQVSTADDTVCLFTRAPHAAPAADAAAVKLETTMPPPKRARTETDLLSCTFPVDTSVLASLQNDHTLVEQQTDRGTVVHGRLCAKPILRYPCTASDLHLEVPCGAISVYVKVEPSQADDLYTVQQILRRGDEVVFIHVCFQHGRWVADSVDNISTTRAILLAPFMITFVDRANVQSSMTVGQPCSTVHVCVTILYAHVMQNEHGLSHVLLTVLNHRSTSSSQCDTDDSTTPWYVAVSHRGLHELFGINILPDAFWARDASQVKQVIHNSLPRIRTHTWVMTLTCHFDASPHPQLCACVLALPPMLSHS